MDIKIDMHVDEDMLSNFIKLYLSDDYNEGFEKDDFEKFMKWRLCLHGSDSDSQFGEYFYQTDFPEEIENKANEIFNNYYGGVY